VARTLHLPHRARAPIGRLGIRVHPRVARLDAPIDLSREFVCPTLTPLYYTATYSELSPAQTLRYNQLTGMCFNELIAFFEQSFATTALAALCETGPDVMPPELAGLLRTFMEEEREHWEMWQRLNRLSAPRWYEAGERHIVRIPPAVVWLLGRVARRPVRFPVVVWVMLALEEHSMEISRRCARVPEDRLEPQYAAAYRRHMEDEARHVQIDWHLLERLYASAAPGVRRMNAWLLRAVMGRFFLRPTNSAVRVVDLLIAEFPEAAPLRPRIARELKLLDRNPEYHRMMYSRTATPITFALFDHFPELRGMSEVLTDYHPGRNGSGEDSA
jgi:hypothetical protein